MDNIHPGVVLALLLAAVPLQMYLSPRETSDIKYYLQGVTDNLFRVTSKLGIYLPGHDDRYSEEEEKVEAAAVGESVHFAGSTEPRTRRPGQLFKLGDVVRHKQRGYRAAVIGWDTVAKAPADWLERVHADNPEWGKQPNYAILVDERDRAIPQLAYVPEEKLELIHEPINHFLSKHYFEKYDVKRRKFIGKPYLQRVYPDD